MQMEAPPTARASRDTLPGGGSSSLLLVLPRLFHWRGDTLEVEKQSANGLRRYREHFERVTLVAGSIPRSAPLPPSLLGVDAKRFAEEAGVTLHPLPRLDGYRRALREHGLGGIHRIRREVAEKLRGWIAEHDVLQFTPTQHVDDWGSLAAGVASASGRPYAVYTDRVQEQMVLDEARGQGLAARVRARVYHHMMSARRHRAIRGARLGMFHGADCHAAYSGMCAHEELVHDIHTKKGDAIGDAAFAEKRAAADDADGPLKVVYAGRIDADKGPLDFVEAVAAAVNAGADVRAAWYGDGALMPQMQQRVAELGLGERLRLPGFTADREEMLSALREHHLMMFCHKVPESPRCLIEAMVCGTPLLGYDSAYSRDLIGEGSGGPPAGRHVPRHDHAALGAALAGLAADRPALLRLMDAAREKGRHFNDEDVFRHRCETLLKHLG